ncbi:Asp-tRNA(Asn)/Glu-tRNA(Gln) amidotransferase subunit GatB [Candidatus Woesearchaeota archaeon]|nr:Asp-tRNA(Asn)/Glu-tRNA(Gln) amidotransferase subunit GatB [Candidatus Woesearchaeota archaeon]
MKFNTDVVIGLEIHIELDTKTKLFCGCSTKADKPNSSTCEICLGFPGSKPVLNKKAVDYSLRLCLATNSKIASELIFSRKNYFYPDMSKNYQITQYELPIGDGGELELSTSKKVGLVRIHIEEDPASLVHPAGMHDSAYVLVDYNRSGRPLCELVTQPELTSPEEARDFMKQLINVLRYLKIFDVNNGVIKADANISIKEGDYNRVEVKNITGFKEIERALNYEIQRQKQVVKEGKKIILETRAWDAQAGVTHSMRSKESEADYGYILDPDLVITDITNEWVKKIKDELPELPRDRAKRYVSEYKISADDAKVLTQDYDLAEFFNAVVKKTSPVQAARWARRELVRVLNYNNLEFSESKITPDGFATIVDLYDKKKITDNVAKKILEKLVIEKFDVKDYIKNEGLGVVSDSGKLEGVVKEVIKNNPKAVEEFKAGKGNALNFLVGQVMRQTRGAASPEEVIKIIKSLI